MGSFPACCGKLLSLKHLTLVSFFFSFLLALLSLLCDRDTVTLHMLAHQRSLDAAKPRASDNYICSALQLFLPSVVWVLGRGLFLGAQ